MMEWFQYHYHAFVAWAYVVGFLLTDAVKLIRCIRYEKARGVKTGKAILDWFFEPTRNNVVSWVTTLGVVWCVGTIYINSITLRILPEWTQDIPVRIPFAFALGSLAEWIVPEALKIILGTLIERVRSFMLKISGGENGSSPQ